jgi:hypothetical protein
VLRARREGRGEERDEGVVDADAEVVRSGGGEEGGVLHSGRLGRGGVELEIVRTWLAFCVPLTTLEDVRRVCVEEEQGKGTDERKGPVEASRSAAV